MGTSGVGVVKEPRSRGVGQPGSACPWVPPGPLITVTMPAVGGRPSSPDARDYGLPPLAEAKAATAPYPAICAHCGMCRSRTGQHPRPVVVTVDMIS